MSYTGTGTQEDPYIVTNIVDFRNLLTGSEGETSYIKFGSNIDCNDGCPIWTSVESSGSTINVNLNNKTLRNINTSGNNELVHTQAGYPQTIVNFSNGTIQNFFSSSCSCSFWAQASLDKVSFGGELLAVGYQTPLSFNNVSESNIHTKILNPLSLNRVYANTNISYSIITTDIYNNLGSNNAVYDSIGGHFTTSAIKGRIETVSVCEAHTYNTFTNSMANSYIAMDIIPVNGQPFVCRGASIYSGVNFFDKDRFMSSVNCTETNNFKGYTTAQCKNLAFLQSEGFPVYNPSEV